MTPDERRQCLDAISARADHIRAVADAILAANRSALRRAGETPDDERDDDER